MRAAAVLMVSRETSAVMKFLIIFGGDTQRPDLLPSCSGEVARVGAEAQARGLYTNHTNICTYKMKSILKLRLSLPPTDNVSYKDSYAYSNWVHTIWYFSKDAGGGIAPFDCGLENSSPVISTVKPTIRSVDVAQ